MEDASILIRWKFRENRQCLCFGAQAFGRYAPDDGTSRTFGATKIQKLAYSSG
jgi:hypothetical protein